MNDCWNQTGVGGDRSCPELEVYVHCRNCPISSTQGRKLLEREAPEGYLQEWTELLTQKKEEQAVKTVAVGIFRIGGEWLALPASQFAEVTEPAPIHSLPHRSNSIILGIASIRGEILPCISLGELLKLEATASTPKVNSLVYQRMVVVESQGNRWVFLVDEMYGVHYVLPMDLRSVPATVSKATGTYTKSIINWQGNSVSFLDDELLFYSLNRRVV